MTQKSSNEPRSSGAGSEPSAAPPGGPDDQRMHDFEYGHGRMPLFMKIVWLAFLAFAAFYTAFFLLDALGSELGAG
jgi:hypothetical protein